MTPLHDRIYALLRAALMQTPAETALFETMSDTEWDELYRLSIRQGVMTLVFDGYRTLPKELQPSLDINVQWGMNIRAIEKRYSDRLAATRKLCTMFSEGGIRTMVMKGIGIGALYPIPSHRQFGDLDIYTFDKFERSCQILAQHSAHSRTDYYRHAEYHFDGCLVENHRLFVETHINRINRYIEQVLESLLDNVSPHPDVEGLLMPSPTFNALFLLRHSSWHYARENINLRDLCDWTLLWKHCGTDIDHALIEEAFRRSGLERYAAIISDICRTRLGAKIDILTDVHLPALTSRVEQDIMQFDNSSKHHHKGFLHTIYIKLHKRIARKWCYDKVVPDSFYGNTLSSLWNYMRHPLSLLKTKE